MQYCNHRAKFTPNKQSFRELNYRFPDVFISHIGEIKVVVSISGGLDFQSFQNKPGENIFDVLSDQSKLDDN